MSDLIQHLAYEKEIDWILSFEPNLPVPGASCGHSLRYQTVWEGPFCGLCFLQDGYRDELPGRLHVTKQLADNGNPQQTGGFQGHVRVAEGIRLPSKDESMTHFRASRGKIHRSKERPGSYPIADSLWYIAGKQPPLAKPLIFAVVRGYPDTRIAAEMNISILNLVGRMEKAINMTTNYLRYSYD